MYGLLLRSVQAYTRATHGPAVWARVLRAVNHPADGFEPMLTYTPELLAQVLEAVSAELGRPQEVILEDVGTFLVADSAHQALRRLLRFGGPGFLDFLHSLEELPDRARLALPRIEFPRITVIEAGAGCYRLQFSCAIPALFPVALGTVRAIADDYGALVLIDAARPTGRDCTVRVMEVQVLEASHGTGRKFDLTRGGIGLGR